MARINTGSQFSESSYSYLNLVSPYQLVYLLLFRINAFQFEFSCSIVKCHLCITGSGLGLAWNGGSGREIRKYGSCQLWHLFVTKLKIFLSFLSDCTVRTTDNKCCVFPFLYEGERHFTCASSLFGGSWCATTYNYDEDEEWGECLGLFYFHSAGQVWSGRDEVKLAVKSAGRN